MPDMILRDASSTPTARCLDPRTSLAGATRTNQRWPATPSWAGEHQREARSTPICSPGRGLTRGVTTPPSPPHPRALCTTPHLPEPRTARRVSPLDLRHKFYFTYIYHPNLLLSMSNQKNVIYSNSVSFLMSVESSTPLTWISLLSWDLWRRRGILSVCKLSSSVRTHLRRTS